MAGRFDWLRDPDPDAGASPPLLMVFDLLYRDGRDLSAGPLRDRRARLDAVAGRELVFPVGGCRLTGWRRGSRSLSAGTRGQRVRGRADEAVAEGECARADRCEERWRRRISAPGPSN